MLMYQELGISIDGQQASLGYQQIHLPAARVDRGSVTGHDDHQDIRIVAAGGAAAVIRYAQNLPAGPQPADCPGSTAVVKTCSTCPAQPPAG